MNRREFFGGLIGCLAGAFALRKAKLDLKAKLLVGPRQEGIRTFWIREAPVITEMVPETSNAITTATRLTFSFV